MRIALLLLVLVAPALAKEKDLAEVLEPFRKQRNVPDAPDQVRSPKM